MKVLATEGRKIDSSNPQLESLKCVVCFEYQRCICTQPCGHLVMCGTCFFEHLITRETCIVCRNQITGMKIVDLRNES